MKAPYNPFMQAICLWLPVTAHPRKDLSTTIDLSCSSNLIRPNGAFCGARTLMPPQTADLRRNVGIACTSCRVGKVKCDGRRPTCSSCKARKKECCYKSQGDKRRVSLRKAVQILAAHNHQLLSLAEKSSFTVPYVSSQDQVFLNHLLGTLGLEHYMRTPKLLYKNGFLCDTTSVNPSEGGDGSDGEEINHLDLRDHDLFDRWKRGVLPIGSNANISLDDGLSQNFIDSGNDHIDAIDEISARVGSLQMTDDGQYRYYGATSNLNLLEDLPIQNHRPVTLQELQQHQIHSDELGIGLFVSDELEEHLIRLYFAWENPSIPVVHEKMYYMERNTHKLGKTNSSYYSEFLTNAICSIGAAYEKQHHPSLPSPLPEFFASKAKAYLVNDLDSPTVSTVQGLVVLSSHEAVSTRDARGWLYSGMSMRLAFDLGLHLDMTSHFEAGKMTAIEIDASKAAFWGSYVAENLWSFYLGRPIHLNHNDITVQKPIGTDRIDRNLWNPYPLQSEVPLPDPSNQVTSQLVQMCELMTSLESVLYGSRKSSDSELYAHATSTYIQLLGWKERLPLRLQLDLKHMTIDSTPLPHILQLHLQYHQSLIFLYRPFFRRSYHREDSGFRHDRSEFSPGDLCLQAAFTIIEILRVYAAKYTVHRINVQAVHVVFSAALILTFASVYPVNGYSPTKVIESLHSACDGLKIMSKIFPNAARALNLLTSVERKWLARRDGVQSDSILTQKASINNFTNASIVDTYSMGTTIETADWGASQFSWEYELNGNSLQY